MLAPGNVAAAAVLIGGAVVLVAPWHAPSVARLVVLTVAAAAVLHAVASIVPEWTATGWSPFDRRPRPREETRDAKEIARIRVRLSGRRQPIGDAWWLPPETLRLLQPLVRDTLRRGGGRSRPSTLAQAVLDAEPLPLPRWLGTRRGDPQRVAELVHGVLDDLERAPAMPRQRTPSQGGAT